MGVDASLLRAVVCERRVGHLDDQGRRSRVLVQVVARGSRDHGKIGLRLGGRAGRQGVLHPDRVGRAERAAKGLQRQVDGRGMTALLRGLLDDLPFQKLQPVGGSEHTRFDQSIVLGSRPEAGAGREGSGHEGDCTMPVSGPGVARDRGDSGALPPPDVVQADRLAPEVLDQEEKSQIVVTQVRALIFR